MEWLIHMPKFTSTSFLQFRAEKPAEKGKQRRITQIHQGSFSPPFLSKKRELRG
jgi:hypothetical protein